MKTTDRGFVIYDEFKDSRNCDIRVQESSIAGDPHIYLFCLNGKNEMGTPVYHNKPIGEDVSAHLNVEQAERLILALDSFIDHVKAENYWRNDPQYIKNWRS